MNATPNMPAAEWPELESEEIRQVGEALQGSQQMQDHANDGPLPGTS